MKDLKTPPMSPVPWIVWDVSKTTNFCTVTSRSWMQACEEGRKRLGCEKVDADLESEKPLEKLESTRKSERMHSIDTCVICNNSPCNCHGTIHPLKIEQKIVMENSAEDILLKYIRATDPNTQCKYRNMMIVMIFRKLFDV